MKRYLGVLVAAVLCMSTYGVSAEVTSEQIDAANFLAGKWIIVDQSAVPKLYELEKDIQRQAVMKVVMKLSGREIVDQCSGQFEDVDVNDWPCKYIEAALFAGYIADNADFRPYDFITMTEAMKLVLKSKGIQKIQETDNWQEDYMMTAYEYGIIDEKYYNYNDNASRGWIFEIATATIRKENAIFEAGWIISDEAELEAIVKEEEAQEVKEEIYLTSRVGSQDPQTVEKWQRNVELATFNVSKFEESGFYRIEGHISIKPEYSDTFDTVETLYLAYQKREDYSQEFGAVYYDSNIIVSEVSSENLETGENIVFEFDDSLSTAGQFVLLGDISQNALPGAKLNFSMVEFWEVISGTGEWAATLANNERVSIGAYLSAGVTSVKHEWLVARYYEAFPKTVYLEYGKSGQNIGRISLEKQLAENSRGLLDFESLELEIGWSIDVSSIQRITLKKAFSTGNEITGTLSWNRVIFDDSVDLLSNSSLDIFISLGDVAVEGDMKTLSLSLVDLKVMDREVNTYLDVAWLPTISSEFFVADKNASAWNITISSEVNADLEDGITANAQTIRLATLDFTANNGDLYIDEITLEKRTPGDYINESIKYMTLFDPDRGDFLPDTGYFTTGQSSITMPLNINLAEWDTKSYDVYVYINGDIQARDIWVFTLKDAQIYDVNNNNIKNFSIFTTDLWVFEILED